MTVAVVAFLAMLALVLDGGMAFANRRFAQKAADAGALAGALIPVILRQIGIDPAIAGGVVLTTVTDVVGIVAFLGMATLVMG